MSLTSETDMSRCPFKGLRITVLGTMDMSPISDNGELCKITKENVKWKDCLG